MRYNNKTIYYEVIGRFCHNEPFFSNYILLFNFSWTINIFLLAVKHYSAADESTYDLLLFL